MIAIVEDHALLRATLREALELADAGPVADFPDCEAALKAMPELKPNVVILDIGLPGISGLEGIRQLKTLAPLAEILMFTVFDDQARIFEAIRAGASGYLLKSEKLSRIVSAVEEIQRGGAPMSPEIARLVLDRFARSPAAATSQDDNREDALSEQELNVIRLLADGLTRKEIAAELNLSTHTIDTYIRRIYAKLHANTVGGAVAKALREGLL